MQDHIEYEAPNGTKGLLYNWHYDSWTREWNYSMSIYDKDDYEILHTYNATPKTLEELKDAVEHSGSYFIRDLAKKMEMEDEQHENHLGKSGNVS